MLDLRLTTNEDNHKQKNNIIKKIAGCLDELLNKLNQSQKIIVGFIVASIFFIITLQIADEAATVCRPLSAIRGGGVSCVSKGPFHMDDTWYIWILYLSLIGYLEFKLFGNQNKKKG